MQEDLPDISEVVLLLMLVGIKLLGLPLLKIDSLLSVGQWIETFTVDSTV